MEVPAHLIERSVARRAHLDERQLIAEQQEIDRSQAEIDATEALPTECRDCMFRPLNAGGNRGCSELSDLIGRLDGIFEGITHGTANDSFSVSRGIKPALTLLGSDRLKRTTYAERIDPEEYTEVTRQIDKVAAAAGDTVMFLKDTFSQEGIGSTKDIPEGVDVRICIKGLSAIVDETVLTDAHDRVVLDRMVEAAQSVAHARKSGIKI